MPTFIGATGSLEREKTNIVDARMRCSIHLEIRNERGEVRVVSI